MNKSKKILSRPMVIAIAVELLLNFLAYYGTRVFMGDKYHYDLTNSLDNMIPVMPAFILIYYGSYLFWIVNYILGCRQDEDTAFRFLSADFIAKCICLVIFVAFPTTNIRPVINEQGVFYDMLRSLYAVDAADNLFPSIHCLTSWFCFIAVRGNKNIKFSYKTISLIIAIFICISTVTTKQHVLVDVAGGILIAEACYHLVKYTGFWKVYKKGIKAIEQRVSKKN